VTTALLPDTYQLGDLIWNARDADGVEWIVTKDDDWWTGPGRRLNHYERPFADGYGRSRSFAGARTLTFEVMMIAPSRELRDARLRELAGLFGDGDVHPLVGPGVEADGTPALYELLVEYTNPPDPKSINSTAVALQFTFIAPDSVKRSVTEYTTGEIELPSSTGGLTFPVTFPAAFNAVVTSGSALVTNGGTADVGLILRIDGPAPQPRITLARGTDVQTLRCNLTVEAGQWLTIDTATRSVLLNDLSSRRGLVAGTFPILAPGTSELSWDCDSYEPAARLTATWRNAQY
jgi:hypothetical protein